MTIKEVVVNRSKYDGIGKSEVEIGVDEDGLYFEAGSEEAASSFIALLSVESEGAIAYVETHIVTYEEVEVDMAKVTEAEQGRGVCANRIELIHMIANLIESSEIRLIEDRDDASMLAIHIVDGLEDEADILAEREIGISSDKSVLVCPECGALEEEITTFTDHGNVVTKCLACGHQGNLLEFRTAAAGAEGSNV